MKPELLAGLNTGELLQLGINAGAEGDGASALVYFKAAAAKQDANAVAHFLLGAEYAQNKLYREAVGEMEAALALDPGLAHARFQLGLLWMTLAEAGHAELALAPLDELGDANPLFHFGRGLRHLLKDQTGMARECLAAGLQCGDSNAPLARDMEALMASLPASAASPGDAAAPDPDADDSALRQVLIAAYTGNRT